jgi:hypothetical protein
VAGLVETSRPSSTMGRPGACVAVMTRLPDLGDRQSASLGLVAALG